MLACARSGTQGSEAQRGRDLQDRRACSVTITGMGKRALTKAEPEFVELTFAAFSGTERDQLTALLGKLLDVA